ncbi:MAG: YabN family protein [Slackia sp.]
MIEEAFEAVDAIEADDVAHMREELGDVLLQVVLQSQIAADAGEFDIDDVCRDIDAKMVRRHPHVFGDAAAQDASEVLGIWDAEKLKEKQAADAESGERAGLLEGVPTSFPALMQAQKISRKAVAVGFEWECEADVGEDEEEIAEFKAAATPDEAELDLAMSYSLVNVARWRGVDAEGALRRTCAKFRSRWSFIEGAAWAQGRDVAELSRRRWKSSWQQAKRDAKPASLRKQHPKR